MGMIKTIRLWFADFETFIADSEYFKKNNRTAVYAWSLVKVPVHYDNRDKEQHPQWMMDTKPLKPVMGVDLRDFFNKIIYDSHKQKYSMNNKVIFHNGMGFDQYFILDWLKEQPDFKEQLNSDLYQENGIGKTRKDRLQERPFNFYTESRASQYFLLSIYIWIPEKKKHAIISFYDSRKWIPGSVEKISKEYATKEDAIMKDWLQEHYPNLDLHKKPLEIDYIQDMDKEYIYTKDNEKITIKDFTNLKRSSKYNDKVKMIQDRVVNDSVIMCLVVAYCILHEIIANLEDGRIYGTASSVAIQKFTHEYCIKHNITNKEDKNPKNFWNKFIYRIEEQDRKKVNNEFFNYRTGGFCSLNSDIKGKVIHRDDIRSYDVCSLYPSVCVYNQLPYGMYTLTRKLPKDLTNKFVFVYFECERIKQLVKNCQDTIPYKWLDGIRPKKIHYTKDLQGNIKGFTILPTFKDLLLNENYYKIDNLKNVKYYVFNSDYYLKDFMEEKYKIKQTATKESQKLAAKLIMNGFTGKSAQSEDQDTAMDAYGFLNMFEDLDSLYEKTKELNIQGEYKDFDKLKEAWENKDTETVGNILFNMSSEVAHAYYPLYIAITSLGRYKTMELSLRHAYLHPKTVMGCYSDTDSYKFYGTPLSENETTTKEESKLGYWLEEFKGEVDYFIVVRPKVWVGYKSKFDLKNRTDKKDEYVLATGGISQETVKEYLRQNNNDLSVLNGVVKLKDKASRRCLGGKIIFEIEKELGADNE